MVRRRVVNDPQYIGCGVLKTWETDQEVEKSDKNGDLNKLQVPKEGIIVYYLDPQVVLFAPAGWSLFNTPRRIFNRWICPRFVTYITVSSKYSTKDVVPWSIVDNGVMEHALGNHQN